MHRVLPAKRAEGVKAPHKGRKTEARWHREFFALDRSKELSGVFCFITLAKQAYHGDIAALTRGHLRCRDIDASRRDIAPFGRVI